MKFATGGYPEFDLAADWNTNEFSHSLDPFRSQSSGMPFVGDYPQSYADVRF